MAGRTRSPGRGRGGHGSATEQEFAVIGLGSFGASPARRLEVMSHQAEQVGRLSTRGVLFAACAHSLSQLQIARDTLLESVEVVSSGVGELVKKQTEGWAYIRP